MDKWFQWARAASLVVGLLMSVMSISAAGSTLDTGRPFQKVRGTVH